MVRRVVVTGYGVISPLGQTVSALWENIKEGKSGITKLEAEEFSGIHTQIAGSITDFDATQYMDKKELSKYDLFIQYALAASQQALEQANINMEQVNKERLGVYIGSGIGGIETILANHQAMLDNGPRKVSPFMVPMMISNMAAGIIAIKTGFKGPSFSPVSACATGNQAIGEAFLNIRHGYADGILAGGAEAPINPLSFAGFSRMKAMSTRNDAPEQASRPFDSHRDGFVMSEGAGVVFLEEYEHAKQRGATILGEIVGYGVTTDAFHITAPDFTGAANAMKLALSMGDIDVTAVDYINAHGTSTPEGDKSETKAIKSVFGEHAYQLKVSSTKSMTGHLFGAAGGIEAIITLKSIMEGIIPPTINYETPDPECDLNYVPNEALHQTVNIALSNGFGFGGHNAVLAFKKFEE
ncbi:beta-ketoacyl-ACP synthase II [Lysinibacillus fusiformis]|uniref:beta-ketoacyl-ACP synthase II n=1 Tax=Lysinibacillus fusiformis TaxID=28031 RepID=UPI000503B679|nr:beta-ketoacyl-ACP synthase II [Lysinibacillus fusiformis]KAB0442930.1 beta-ketoacyl-[acyl-carrier-protein] synthase II [Lysinibacillus fusiformis]KGA80367.1 3-oxoacyl-ACP synthase [Lysinibacillus fusiformis]MCK1988069.1 beta-ketoacyl-ACP synthase II [Lysinibacillus fusiformis]MCT6929013.1 beta-ketoacyl-ACP synthase II [Lysinibacillus fusiformis]MCT6932083.1 beta-ketoacyl-ACP synthase II [Lysinibacillus fusiformis]